MSRRSIQIKNNYGPITLNVHIVCPEAADPEWLAEEVRRRLLAGFDMHDPRGLPEDDDEVEGEVEDEDDAQE